MAKTGAVRVGPVNLGTEYYDVSGQHVVSLADDGLPCIPVFSRSRFSSRMPSLTEHIHLGHIEILYCLRGDITYESMGESFAFRPGNIFVSRPDEPHRMVNYPKGLDTYGLLFRIPPEGETFLHLPREESSWLRERLMTMPRRLFNGTDMTRKLFHRVFEILDTAQKGTAERRLLLRVAVVNLLLDIVAASRNRKRVLPLVKVEGIVEEMRAHPEASYPVDDLVRRSGLSETNFTHRFKAATGLPPHAFLLACRVECAKAMLTDLRRPIAAIASDLGFPSSQHFATQFRKLTGISPRAWRNDHAATPAKGMGVILK